MFATLRGASPIQNFFLMQTEKTPQQLLQERFDFLKESFEIVVQLKNLYKYDLQQKEKEIELIKQGTPSFLRRSYLDFEKAKVYVKPDFSELQMLN